MLCKAQFCHSKLSVCLSVMLMSCGHIGSTTSKTITCIHTHPKIWGVIGVGHGNSTKPAISLKRGKIQRKYDLEWPLSKMQGCVYQSTSVHCIFPCLAYVTLPLSTTFTLTLPNYAVKILTLLSISTLLQHTTHINKPWVNILRDHSARSRTQQLTKLTVSEEKHKILVWQTALHTRHAYRHAHTYCKTLYFHCILISWFQNVKILVPFYLTFSKCSTIRLIRHLMSKLNFHQHLISHFYATRKNLMHAKSRPMCFTVHRHRQACTPFSQ